MLICTALLCFRGVYAMQSDLGSIEVEGVAIHDAGRAGYIGGKRRCDQDDKKNEDVFHAVSIAR